MKNYIFLRITFLFFFIISIPANAQISLGPLNLINSSFVYYDPTTINVSATPSQSVLLEVGSGNYELYANEQIVMSPGFTVTASANSTGHFVADIVSQLPTPVFFDTDISAVGQYQKMEMGISLPSLESKINTFLDDNTGQYKVASTGYHNAFNDETIINPYDPEHISVNALFYKPGTTTNPTIRYGFFYKEYDRAPLPEGWIETHNPDAYPYSGIDPYEWRVRFSPDELGVWNCMILVYANNQLLPEHYFFQFNVVPSLDPGFVKVADNNQYLQFSNGEQFFPVGDNYAWTEGAGYGNCQSINCVNLEDHKTLPDSYQDNINYINKLTDEANGGGGGNHTRLVFAPWAYEIEFEKLGNYQTRQIEMFELDEYLEYVASKDVYMTIAPLHGAFLYPNGDSLCCLPEYIELFPWNPYNNNHTYHYINDYDPAYDPNVQFKGIDGVNDPLNFFTNPTAKIYFKNKLRYIESRWGYSPHFYGNEIATEIENYDPHFWENPLNAIITQNWIWEMADYLKNDLKSKQLTTLNYGGTPAPINAHPYPAEAYSQIWGNANIDLVTIHNYEDKLGNLRFKSELAQNSLNAFTKPFNINENSGGYYYLVDRCTKRSLHNNVWASAFSGSYSPGLSWEWNTQQHMGDEYKALRNFFTYIDLLNPDGYTPVNSAGIFDSPFEFFTLVKSGGYSDKAYGWVHNRSYNQYTEGNCDFVVDGYNTMQEIIDNNTSLQDIWVSSHTESSYDYFFQIDFQAYPKESLSFVLAGLIPGAEYKIEYYYTSGPLAGHFEPAFDYTFFAYPNGSNFPGVYFIENGPPTGNGYPADWAFLVHLKDDPRSLPLTSGTEVYQDNRLAEMNFDATRTSQYQLDVIPNPNDGNFTISFNSLVDTYSMVSISDLRGNMIYQSEHLIKTGSNQLYFSNNELATGMYFVKLDASDQIFKVVIVK